MCHKDTSILKSIIWLNFRYSLEEQLFLGIYGGKLFNLIGLFFFIIKFDSTEWVSWWKQTLMFLIYICISKTQHLHAWALSANVHSLCLPPKNEMARTIKVTGTCRSFSEQHNSQSNSIRWKAASRARGCRAENLIHAHKTGSWMPLISQNAASNPCDSSAACYQSFFLSLSRLYCAPNSLEWLFFYTALKEVH